MVRYSLSPREIQLPVGRIFFVFPSRAGLILKKSLLGHLRFKQAQPKCVTLIKLRSELKINFLL